MLRRRTTRRFGRMGGGPVTSRRLAGGGLSTMRGNTKRINKDDENGDEQAEERTTKRTTVRTAAYTAKKNNKNMIIFCGVGGVILLIVIIAMMSGSGEETNGGRKGSKKSGGKRDFTAMLKDAEKCAREGIAMFDEIKEKVYNPDNLSSYEKESVRSKLRQAKDLLSNAQRINSEVEKGGGEIPGDL